MKQFIRRLSQRRNLYTVTWFMVGHRPTLSQMAVTAKNLN